jgi:ABC-type spermidine/putrescine transport system permease subunit I
VNGLSMRGKLLRGLLLRGLLLSPALFLLCAAIILPIIVGLVGSFSYDGQASLKAYATFVTRLQYRAALLNSLQVGAVSTIVCVAIALPACAFFAAQGTSARGFFLAMLGLSFSISALIKTIAWSVLLSRSGALEYGLRVFGLSDTPVDLLYTKTAVIIGTVQIIVPYTAAIIFSGMRRVDHDLVFAARSLGAGPLKTFWSSYLPQIRQSLTYAGVMTFVLASGIYITPALLGGPTDAMLGQVMNSDLVHDFENGTAMASAAGTVLTAVLLILAGLGIVAGGRSFAVRAGR